jgi:hypothetical protein
MREKNWIFLVICVSSLRRGHAMVLPRVTSATDRVRRRRQGVGVGERGRQQERGSEVKSSTEGTVGVKALLHGESPAARRADRWFCVFFAG